MKNKPIILCWLMLAGWAAHAQNEVTITLTALTVDVGSCIINNEGGNEDPSIFAWVDDTETSLAFKFGYSFQITEANTYTLPNANLACTNTQGIYTFITSQNSLTLWIEILEEDNSVCFPPVGSGDDCVSQGYQTIDLTQSTGTWIGENGFHFNFTITSQPLPVELARFEAKANGEEVLLQWETASERDNAGFDIQRSHNGRDWTDIGYVPGNGQSGHAIQYDFADGGPLPGTNYYRLRQTDFNGHTEYSPVRSVEWKVAGGRLMVFPNPAYEVVHVHWEDGPEAPVHVNIYAAAGPLLAQAVMESGRAEIPLGGLPAGLHFIQIEGREGLMKLAKN